MNEERTVRVRVLKDKHLVWYTVVGAVSDADVIEAYGRAVASTDYQQDMNRLWDFRRAAAEADVNIGNIVEKISQNSGSDVHYINSLLVSGSFEFGVARMYQSMSGSIPADVLLTRDPVAAFEKVGLVYDPEQDD